MHTSLQLKQLYSVGDIPLYPATISSYDVIVYSHTTEPGTVLQQLFFLLCMHATLQCTSTATLYLHACHLLPSTLAPSQTMEQRYNYARPIHIRLWSVTCMNPDQHMRVKLLMKWYIVLQEETLQAEVLEQVVVVFLLSKTVSCI